MRGRLDLQEEEPTNMDNEYKKCTVFDSEGKEITEDFKNEFVRVEIIKPFVEIKEPGESTNGVFYYSESPGSMLISFEPGKEQWVSRRQLLLLKELINKLDL